MTPDPHASTVDVVMVQTVLAENGTGWARTRVSEIVHHTISNVDHKHPD